MAGLGRGKLEVRIDAQGLAEFLAARAFARGGAMDKGEMLVRVRPLAIGEAEIDRRLEVASRIGVFPIVVLAKAGGQRAGAFARLDEIAQRLRGAGGKRDKEAGDKQRARSHRKRCRILTASPALTCTCSTCAGNVELRISMVCAPADTSSTRSGGLTPRLLPSTSTSPHGATASSSRPAPAANACFSAAFLSARATNFFAGVSAFGAAVLGAGGAATGAADAGFGGAAGASSRARAPTPPATSTASTTPEMTSAECRSPSGPVRASHRLEASSSSVWDTVSARRRPAGVPPITE